MREIEYREAIREAVIEEMDRDGRVFLIGEDIGAYHGAFKAYRGLLSKYGAERVIDTPISENTIIGAGIGAALTGFRPVTEIMFVDFSTLAMDQIINQAAKVSFMTRGKVNVPLVIRTQGGVGKGLGAQHSQSLESLFYHIPGLKLAVPSTPYDVKGLLKTAIRDDSPVIFMEHKMIYNVKGPVPDKEYTVPFGKADIKKEGRDVTIFAYSNMVLKSLEAVRVLEREGISCEVVDPRTLVPLDIDLLLDSVKKTRRLLIVSEACRRGSIASDISAKVTAEVFDSLIAPIKIVAGLNTPIPYNPTLEEASVPQVADIVKAARELMP
jgi:pyruvate/2-oxoglutarate/acetoin dehydrogenase E1 component